MSTCILWDLDGTLLDTLEDLLDATNNTLRRHGFPERTKEQLRRFVGNGAANQIRLSLPERAEAMLPEVLADYQVYYAAHCRNKTRPYPGVSDVLAQLRTQYPMAIVSNKPDSAVKALCDMFFPGIPAMGELPDRPRKPAPDMVLHAMQLLGADRCIYVGDSDVDILTAKNAGARCLSVLWGFRDREELEAAGGEHFCDSPHQLTEKIEELIHAE